jgi:hypothetical protein
MFTLASNSRSGRAKGWLILFGVLVVVLVTSLIACAFAISIIARHSLYIHGFITLEAPAQLGADDLADNLLSRKGWAPLQEWSAQTMARYRAGQLATEGRGLGYRGPRLATNEVPNWVRGGWDGPPKSVAVILDRSNEPVCVDFTWGVGASGGGVLVGPTNFIIDYRQGARVKPGIYAYYNER